MRLCFGDTNEIRMVKIMMISQDIRTIADLNERLLVNVNSP